MSITLHLTTEQQAQIAPLLRALLEMSEDGFPGSLVAQVYGGTARLVLMDASQAMRFNAAMQAAGIAE